MDVFTEKRKERENMHLHKLADLLSFHEVAVGGTLPQTEYYREKAEKDCILCRCFRRTYCCHYMKIFSFLI